jgi:hypothetical protein
MRHYGVKASSGSSVGQKARRTFAMFNQQNDPTSGQL